MLKKIVYFLVILLFLLPIIGYVGVRKFNNLYFQETPNYLSYTHSPEPIGFLWNETSYEDHVELHSSMLISVTIKGFPHKFYFQFDTGSPQSFIYGNPLKSIIATGWNVKYVVQNEERYIENFEISMGGKDVKASMVEIKENYGKAIDMADTITNVVLGTIGADFMDNKITAIDFANQSIQFYDERPDWMASLSDFKPFGFRGRRFMLPAIIDGNELELFYDSGTSAFGLLTSKHRYDKFSDKNEKEIEYSGSRWGESLGIHHRATTNTMLMGGSDLQLKRISYVDMYASFQRFMTPFTRIGGWLGNKPFIESILILDTKKGEFIVVKS